MGILVSYFYSLAVGVIISVRTLQVDLVMSVRSYAKLVSPKSLLSIGRSIYICKSKCSGSDYYIL